MNLYTLVSLYIRKYRSIIKIQKIFRSYNMRKKRLPNVMYYIKQILKNNNLNLININTDGRINSSLSENIIINNLKKYLENRIKIPKVRMWYDVLIKDFAYGWIPLNIKITTTKTSDNTGNLAMCVYAYTDEELCLSNQFNNGHMSKLLINKLKNNKINNNYKKDYYFLVINKTNTKNIIINSLKGLNKLTTNLNNLPFQIKWCDNKKYNYDNINNKIKLFLNCFKNSKKSWKEEFLNDIRKL